jgi:hypothetical protein
MGDGGKRNPPMHFVFVFSPISHPPFPYLRSVVDNEVFP